MRNALGLMTLAAPIAALAAQAADVEAPPALVRAARTFGDITVTAKVNGRGDKVVVLGGTIDDPRVIAIQVVTESNPAIVRQPGALAILRTRARQVGRPIPEDFAIAKEMPGTSIFIIGEWTKPALIWELGTRKGQPSFRLVDKDGVAKAWQVWR